MYLEYQKERLGIEFIEDKYGFITYKTMTLNDNDYTYIVDIYIIPDERKWYKASDLARRVEKIAKEKGHKGLLGTVVPSANNSTVSLKTLLNYGFEVLSSENDLIWFKKEI